MSISFKLRWILLNLIRIRFGLFRHPVFTLRLFWKRIGWLFLRRFIGDSIQSPVTGEWIFNSQSLTSYWAFHCIKELGTDWEQHIRNTAAPVVYDVGSNLGQFRSLVLSLNPGARVRTVDAWKEMGDYVDQKNHVSSGVGSETGTARLYRDPNGLTASTSEGFYKGENRTVPILTLDGIWNCEPVDLLKIDIDGSEYHALLGAQKMLPSVKILIVETEIIETIKDLCPNRTWSTVNNYDWVGTQI